MPYAPETYRATPSGTSNAAVAQQIIDLFGFAGLHQLAPALEPLAPKPGQKGRNEPHWV